MVLRVAVQDFPEAVRRYAKTSEVFVSDASGLTTMSAINSETGVIVTASSEMTIEGAKEMMKAAEFTVVAGEWSQRQDDIATCMYVAAVSYRSKDPSPGLWVHAYYRQPTVMEVLRKIYDEFVETGEARKATFEQFMSSAKPNVLILSPEDLESFASE